MEITEAGLYPFRLLQFQGSGGANLELFTIEPDGSKVLVNDSVHGGVRSWRAEAGLRPYVSWIDPVEDTLLTNTNTTVTIELHDSTLIVDTSAIVMKVNGQTVSPTINYTAPITTISYDSLGGDDNAITLIYSALGNGDLYTNKFNISVLTPSITYVDAVPGAKGNTTVWDAESMSFVSYFPPENVSGQGGDNEWEYETDYANTADQPGWLEANREGAEDCPQLRTRVEGLENGVYNAYVYFWGPGPQIVKIGAALTNNPSGSLPVYTQEHADASDAMTNSFSNTVIVEEADRNMYQVDLGLVTVTDGILDVYIDDEANGGFDSTVWYDGIGYKYVSAGGPEYAPVITSISVSGSTVTLSWTADDAGSYTIERKSSLTGKWSPVETGLPAGNSIRSVPAGGGSTEFYRITAE